MRFSALLSLMVNSIGAVCAVAASGQSKPASADYPNRVVRFILPQPAGGGTDVVARAVASKLTEAWGQQVIVDNRPGGQRYHRNGSGRKVEARRLHVPLRVYIGADHQSLRLQVAAVRYVARS